MRSDMEITYLLNSGFLVKLNRTLLVFDDFSDPANAVNSEIAEHNFDNLYIFASHAHFDHFDSHILDYQKDATKYIFGNDIKHTKRARAFPAEKTLYMKKYEAFEDKNIKVTSFDSTDVGTSFSVETEGKSFFHAGDFNWWDWPGDTEVNRKAAKLAFFRQLEKLQGRAFDIAFFPVDERIAPSQEFGAKEFLKATDTKNLIAMHRVGFPRWTPSAEFWENDEIPIWSPVDAGERREFN